MVEYRTATGATFSFDGWWPGESPTDCWRAGDWLGCLHGCMLCYHLLGDVAGLQLAVADDGLLHELCHMASGTPICTHNSHERLADQVADLEHQLSARLLTKSWRPPITRNFPCAVVTVTAVGIESPEEVEPEQSGRIQIGPLDA